MAGQYVERGWRVIPVPPKQKAPKLLNWPQLVLKNEDLSREFGDKQNIGVVLGPASGGLVDIDLDCDEALLAASSFLPQTNAIFGRKSSQKSHWFYVLKRG